MQTTPSALGMKAEVDFAAAAEAVGAGDELVSSLVQEIGQRIRTVTAASRKATETAAQLRADDIMNIEGRDRLLGALPGDLKRSTNADLEHADQTLDAVEAFHRSAILKHDHRRDAELIFELNNYAAPLTPETAAPVLLELAADPRYSTFLSGPAGRSLAARFGMKDPEGFRRVALESLAVNGSETQQRRSAALARVADVRKAIGLARGARDFTADEVQRPPRPAQAAVR